MRRYFDYYLAAMKVAILEQLQYRVANYLYLFGMIAESIIYMVVWSTVARAEGGVVGGYAQGDFAVLTNLHVNAGVRYDKYGDFDPSINPRLALIYNPLAKSTFKAIYGSAFRAPNFVELIDPRFQDLHPEEITSYELVYEQGIGAHLRTSLSGFYNQMTDLIVFQSGNYFNMDAETRGTELALEGSWASGIRGRVSYTYQQTDNHSVGWDMRDRQGRVVANGLYWIRLRAEGREITQRLTHIR